MAELQPIFIVGSARSGTSALASALSEGAGIAGDKEGHYITLLHSLTKAAREHCDSRIVTKMQDHSTLARVEYETIVDDLLDMIRTRAEANFPGTSVWFDKTPDGRMLRAIPYILKMWPKARFVFAKRRALENVVSRMRKFPHLSFQENCERWVIAMRLWKERRDLIPQAQRIEIEQFRLATDPQIEGVRLADFLGLDERQKSNVIHALSTLRPESTGGDRAQPLSLDTVQWTASQIDTYKRICAPVNAEWGYSEDSSYYQR